MKRFARLYTSIDSTTRTGEKVDAMVAYFNEAEPADAAWAVYFLSGGRPKRLVPVRRLAAWAMEQAEVSEWLFEESYEHVGDLAETIALLLPAAANPVERSLSEWVEGKVLTLAKMPEDEQKKSVLESWRELAGAERFVWNKLVTGGLRVGVSRSLVVRALARASEVPEAVISHRMSGTWSPTADFYQRLVAKDESEYDESRPYPFFLAYALEGEPESLGDISRWQAEWKWDGIRGQLIRREGGTYLWSRGEELVTDRFPEIVEAAAHLPAGTVIDGEVMPWAGDRPLPFAQLQRRIGRKNVTARIREEVPVVLIAYDLLEDGGVDVRGQPMDWRRKRLRELIEEAGTGARIIISPVIAATDWQRVRDARDEARERGSEGLMLKSLDSPYGVGRRKGGWWKWKVAPYSVDAVLIYAQAGHGRRAALHTDYTFAVRDGEKLVAFAKAYSGLTDAEIRQLDSWVRRNTLEKFGPVRVVAAEHVFEIAFEGIQASPRHKSGVAVRFPRILRWRTDKKPEDADTIETLRALLQVVSG